MDDNVVAIARIHFSLKDDIEEIAMDLEKCESFSPEKLQLQHLLAQVCANEEAPIEERREAARLLIQHSDLRAAIQTVPGWQDLVSEFIQALGYGGLRN